MLSLIYEILSFYLVWWISENPHGKIWKNRTVECRKLKQKFWLFHQCSEAVFVYMGLQVYIWVIASNLVLRCTWTYKLSAHLRHNYLTVFTIAALEIFRRFQWIFFRVENEWNKMNNKSHMQLSMSEMSNGEEKLLHSMNHNV